MTIAGVAFDAVAGVLVVPAAAAALLALLPGYRVTARLNVLATTLTLICAALAVFRQAARQVHIF